MEYNFVFSWSSSIFYRIRFKNIRGFAESGFDSKWLWSYIEEFGEKFRKRFKKFYTLQLFNAGTEPFLAGLAQTLKRLYDAENKTLNRTNCSLQELLGDVIAVLLNIFDQSERELRGVGSRSFDETKLLCNPKFFIKI